MASLEGIPHGLRLGWPVGEGEEASHQTQDLCCYSDRSAPQRLAAEQGCVGVVQPRPFCPQTEGRGLVGRAHYQSHFQRRHSTHWCRMRGQEVVGVTGGRGVGVTGGREVDVTGGRGVGVTGGREVGMVQNFAWNSSQGRGKQQVLHR